MHDLCVKDSKEIQYKVFAFEAEETKTVERDGVKYGIIKGYASTYGNIDRGGDIIRRGAFVKSIERHQKTDRPIRMLYQHQRDKFIGGWPIDKVKDDDKGLYVEGEINLEVPEGNSAYALAKQGVLTDLSIGFSIIDAEMDNDGIMILKELELWEISPVAEPMNDQANIIEVKSVKIEEFKCMKDIEVFLKEAANLSSSERKTLISKIKSFSRDAEKADSERDVVEKINEQLEKHIMLEKLDKINNLLNED